MIGQLQHQIEALYSIGVEQRVEDYLIGKDELFELCELDGEDAIPKELLLVRQNLTSDEVEIALYLDPILLGNLDQHNPFWQLDQKNLTDFCIALEGVSHFVYFLWKAGQKKKVSKLELELQAEIDKFLMLLFFLRKGDRLFMPSELFATLFEHFELRHSLSESEQERYLTASFLASKYCDWIRHTFQYNHQIETLLGEVRDFYALSHQDKISKIQCA